MEKTGNRWKVWNTEINDKETENPSHLLPPSEVATNDGMVFSPIPSLLISQSNFWSKISWFTAPTLGNEVPSMNEGSLRDSGERM